MPPLIASRIDAVTVYRRGAVVTRTAALPAGAEARVRIGPLPLDLDDGSVRVGTEGALRATDVRVTLFAPEPDETLPPARPEDLEAARQRVERLDDRIGTVDRERARIERLGVVSRPQAQAGEPPPASPAEARIALISLRDARLREADARRRELLAERREAQQALADLSERERRASSMRRTEPGELRKAVEVTLHGDPAEGDALSLEYRVDAARWAPSYALRLDGPMREGDLEVRAVVAQKTGEDWDGAELTLSTATLQGWAEIPELPSLRIGRQQPRAPKSGWRPAPVGTDALFDDFDRERDQLDATVAVAAAREPQPVPKGGRAAPPAPPVPTAPSPMTMSGAMPAQAMPMPSAPPPQAKRKRAPARPAAPAEKELDELAALDVPMAAPASRSGGIGAAFGAMGAALASEGGGGTPPRSEVLAMEEPSPGALDRAMLDYGRLRMPGPLAPARGRLVLRSRRALYVEQLEEIALEVNLTAALAQVSARAEAVHDASLPPGFAPPAPSGFDYAYRAAGRLDVPSDGVFHGVTLRRERGEARPRFVVVPRESRDAFRYVELDNPLDAPLLEGPIDVFVGGDFLLTSTVDEVPRGGVLRLGLGVEQRLKVSRNSRFSEKTAGLMGGRLDLLHSIEIELENLLGRDTPVEVRERVPVTRDEDRDVTVEEGEVVPRWTEWEPEDLPTLKGGRRWEVVVAAGQKQTLRASYAIRIASKHELIGGNRRES